MVVDRAVPCTWISVVLFLCHRVVISLAPFYLNEVCSLPYYRIFFVKTMSEWPNKRSSRMTPRENKATNNKINQKVQVHNSRRIFVVNTAMSNLNQRFIADRRQYGGLLMVTGMAAGERWKMLCFFWFPSPRIHETLTW